MSVVAIILTYDAPETLVRCVEACRQQAQPPEHILVIDNAGPSVARQVLERADLLTTNVTVDRTEGNLGPAGGFARGLAWFLDSDHDHAWVMDDDCAPDPTALGHLLVRSRLERGQSVVFPQEVDPTTGRRMNFHSWCGVLLPQSVAQAAGLPREEFFWWMEDSEYLNFRMDRLGISVVRDPDAVVYHDRPRRRGATPVWKVYYEARNTTYVRLRVRRRHVIRRWVRPMLLQLGRALRDGDMRAAKLGAFVQGVSDGWSGRLGKRFPVS